MLVQWQLDRPEEGTLLSRVEGQIFSICHNPVQQHLLMGTMQGSLHVIDLRARKELKHLVHHGGAIFDIQYSAEAQLIYTVSRDGHLAAWDARDYALRYSKLISAAGLRCVRIHGEEIFCGSSDHRVYVLRGNAEPEALEGPLNSVFCLCLVPAPEVGERLLAGSRDAQLHVWMKNGTWVPEKLIKAHLYTINDIQYQPGLQLLASASRDKSIKLWDARELELLKVLDKANATGHHHSVNKLLWMGDHLLSCGDDSRIVIWKVAVKM